MPQLSRYYVVKRYREPASSKAPPVVTGWTEASLMAETTLEIVAMDLRRFTNEELAETFGLTVDQAATILEWTDENGEASIPLGVAEAIGLIEVGLIEVEHIDASSPTADR